MKRGSGLNPQWSALIGLLFVAIVAGVAVILSASYSYRGMIDAAWVVRRQRAAEVANLLASTARAAGIFRDPARLQGVVSEIADPQFKVEVLTIDGALVASSEADRGASGAEGLEVALLAKLRLDGQVFVRRGRSVLFYRLLRLGRGPPPMMAGDRHPAPWSWGLGRRPAGRFRHFRRRVRVVRVEVGESVGADLVRLAHVNLALSSTVALLLFLAASVMFRLARRAGRAERLAHQRRALAQLGEMAAVLAHEIRTPLGSIKGNAQLLAEERTDSRADAIVGEAGRLERLVNGMLDYARPGTPRHREVDANELLQRAAEIVAPIAAERRVALLTEPSESPLKADLDDDQILQVLVNLIQNAVEASAAKPAEARAPVLVALGAQGSGILFRVRDSGVGLDGANPEQLFEPFVTRRRGGSGLGLAVARRIVEQHGGQLELEARAEGGVLARVWFPRRWRGHAAEHE